ncbi:hypothetical protein KBF38_20675 [bacterium]|nr:hypothetical protein [bacterium]
MKRTLSKLLGIAALAIAGICTISAPAQAASWGTPFTTNGVVCSIRTGGTATSYPENSKLQSCLVGTPLRESVRTKVLVEPLATVRTLLNNANVKIYLWDSWTQYKQYYNVSSLPGSISETTTLGFTNQVGIERRIHAVEFLDFGGGVRLSVAPGVPGTVMHEIGHQMDVLWLPPAGLLRHSNINAGSIYHAKLLKDIAKIKTYTPCVDIFKFDVAAGGPVCTGTTLNAPYAGKDNWAIMQMLYPYFTTTSTNSLGTGYAETFAETFSVITSSGQAKTAGSQIDFYLFNDPFVCSRTYIKGWRNTGAAPANSTYLSWCQ